VTTQDAPSGAASGPGQTRNGIALLLIGIPVALLLFALFLLCRPLWFHEASPLWFQALIPIGAGALAVQRRQEIRKIVTELSLLFPDPDHPKRRGTEWLAIIGALMIVFGILALSPTIGLLGLIVLAMGIALYLGGPFVLRGMLGPLGYLFLMLPPPIELDKIVVVSIRLLFASTSFVWYLLKPLQRDSHVQGATLVLSGQPPLDVPLSLSGLDLVLGTLAFGVFVCVWHRLKVWSTLLVLFTALTGGLASNVLRILLLVGIRQDNLLPSPLFMLLFCGLLWLLGIGLARRAAAQVRDL
jgi:hypothetical protein